MPVVQSRRLLIGRPATGSIVSPVRDPDNDAFVQKYACATCKITYQAPRSQKSKCPLCESLNEQRQLLEALQKIKDQLERTTNELNRLRPIVDMVAAMRNALEVTGAEDMAFLKSVAYRFRQDGSVTLNVLTGRGENNRLRVVGFIAKPKKGEVESHRCTSIGGLALTRHVGTALRSVGPQTTMQQLVLAMSDNLPGGL